MKLLEMDVQGFLSYKHAHIDFRDLDYASVTGQNGAGKSTIPLAITWALMGTLRVRGDHDSVVNDDADEAVVKLDFQVDGQVWRVIRRREYRGSGTVRLYQLEGGEWVQFGDHLNATAQEQIYDLIKLSEDAWFSLVLMDYARFSGGTRFTKASSQDRRLILMDLVPELSRWGEYEELAYERRKETGRLLERAQQSVEDLQERIDSQGAELRDLQDELEEIDAEDLKNRAKALDKKIGKTSEELGSLSSAKDAVLAEVRAARTEHDSKIRDLRRDISDARGAVEEYEELQFALNGAQDKVESIREKEAEEEQRAARLRAQIDSASEEVEEARSAAERLQGRVAAAVAEFSALQARLADIDSRIEGLDKQDPESGKCLFCESKLSPDKFASLVDRATHERHEVLSEIEAARSKVSKMERRGADAAARLDEATSHLRSLERDLASAEATINGHREAATRAEERVAEIERDLADFDLDTLRTAVAKAEQALADEEQHWSTVIEPALNARIEEAEGDDRADELSMVLSRLRREREEIASQQSALDTLSGKVESMERSLSRLKKEHKESKASVKELTGKYERLDWLVKAFQPKGIPSMLLDSVLSAIEEEQNKILDSLPGAEGMKVEFRQIKALKGRDGSKDVLDIIVHTPQGHERPIESFSSGELVRLTISNLFAMIQVFNQRHPGLVETIFLDEPLGPLDQAAVPAFIEVLMSAINSGIVSSILVVTHDQRVIEALPQQVVVSKSPEGGSQIDVIA